MAMEISYKSLMTLCRDVKGALAPVAAAETEEAPPSDRTTGKKKTFFLSITNRYVHSLLHIFWVFIRLEFLMCLFQS